MESKVSGRIRRLREEKKMSGTSIAKSLEISPQYYYDIEKGKRNLNAELASKLADILETTTDYLLGKTNVNLYDYVLSPDELTKENSSSYMNEKEFVDKIDLTDDDLLKQFKIELDGRLLSDKEMKKIIAFVRMNRDLDS